MNKAEFKTVTETGQNIAREKLSPDVYAGKKLNDDYTLIVEVEPKEWKPVDNANEVKKGQRFICLANIEVLQTRRPTSIAVPSGFEDLKPGKYFIFKINAEGYSDVKIQEMTEEEAKKLIESDEVA
jgi:hypothetical protein